MENVFENRFRHASELARMGAQISINDRSAIIRGVKQLHGVPVSACELRGGAALVLAGLAAKGATYIENAHYISRGYENIVEELSSLGADIKRIN
jgi:UDP-N-acetylglucosamine 1-carboxyvinyltransferase